MLPDLGPWSLIALVLVASFLYGLLATWGQFGRLLLHQGGHLSRKELLGMFVTLFLATAVPVWIVWLGWRTYGS